MSEPKTLRCSLCEVGEWLQRLLERYPAEAERRWWVTTHRGFGRLLGPFATSEEAVANRIALENATERSDFWVWEFTPSAEAPS